MLRDLIFLLAYIGFFALGLLCPFVLVLGYVWVDTFLPQAVSYSLLRGMPMSQIVAIGALAAYALLDRRSPPRPNAVMVLTLMMGTWVTLTCTWAVTPAGIAWGKWDWAFKTIMFSAFMPFVFRTRVQIEAFVQVYLFSAMIHILTVGLKSAIGGAAYDVNLGVLTESNAGLAEGSTLAAASIMFIPLMLWLRKHSVLVPAQWRTPLYSGLVAVSCSAALGTFARTGLVGFFVLGAGIWVRSRHKVASAILMGVAAACMSLLVSSAWVERISTTATPGQDQSASTRLAVWRWTLDFAQSHPFGGGFDAYVVNVITNTTPDGETVVQSGRAFHNIYFEILGEHGWVGLGLFLGLIATTFLTLRRVVRRTRDTPGMEWCHDLANALRTSALVLFTCGNFVGIAFQPMIWYMFALTAAMAECARRILAAEVAPDASGLRRWAQAASPKANGAATAAGRVGTGGYARRVPAGGTAGLTVPATGRRAARSA